MKDKLFFEMLGEDVSGLVTIEEVLKKANLDYIVDSESLYLSDGTVIPDKFANVIRSNRKVLGIVGKNYKIIQNNISFNFLDELFKEGFKFIRAGSFDNYSGAFVILEGENFLIQDSNFNIIILVTNNFDGSGTVKLEFIPINIEDKSVLLFTDKVVKNKISLKHCKQRNDTISEIKEILTCYDKYRKYFIKTTQALSNMLVESIEDIIKEVIPIDKTTSNIIQARTKAIQDDIINLYVNPTNGGDTARKIVFSVANYESHRLPIRNTGNNQIYLDRILSGMPLTNEMLRYIRRKFL